MTLSDAYNTFSRHFLEKNRVMYISNLKKDIKIEKKQVKSYSYEIVMCILETKEKLMQKP